MKKYFFALKLIVLGSVFLLSEAMEPKQTTELKTTNEPKLIIFNRTGQTLELTVQTARDHKPLKIRLANDLSLRVANARTLQLLNVAPYGTIRGWASSSALTGGLIPLKNYATDAKASLHTYGKDTRMTITLSTFGSMLPYNVEFGIQQDPIKSGKTHFFSYDIFPDVEKAVIAKTKIAPRYFLGASEHATLDELEAAHKSLITQFEEQRDANPTAERLSYFNEAIELVEAAYNSLVLGGEYTTKFENLVREKIEIPTLHNLEPRLDPSAPAKAV